MRTISSPSPSSAGRNASGWRGSSICRSGIPSHDRFNAILAAIKPAEFEKCLLSWITALHEITDGQVIAIDGKTLRRSFDTASGKAAIHMVSAWATANHISLGQVVVDAKSNEITAIPKLLEMLDISGGIGDHRRHGLSDRDRPENRRRRRGLRPGREGQPADVASGHRGASSTTHLEDDFARMKVRSPSRREEKGHGREETRYYYRLSRSGRFARSLRAGLAEGDRDGHQHTQRDGKECNEVRYYILSKYLSRRVALPRRCVATGESRTVCIGNSM